MEEKKKTVKPESKQSFSNPLAYHSINEFRINTSIMLLTIFSQIKLYLIIAGIVLAMIIGGYSIHLFDAQRMTTLANSVSTLTISNTAQQQTITTLQNQALELERAQNDFQKASADAQHEAQTHVAAIRAAKPIQALDKPAADTLAKGINDDHGAFLDALAGIK